MIEYLYYLLLISTLLLLLFFIIRAFVVFVSMFTEVPYLPSNIVFKEAIKYLEIKSTDKVIDIGCGDGRVLRYAAKRHPEAEFVGVDRNILLIIYAKFLNIFHRDRNLKFKCINIHDFNLSEFDKIYLYLLPEIIESLLQEKREELKKGSIVISFHYEFTESFFGINNVVRYPVKYKGKEENIFKWVNR